MSSSTTGATDMSERDDHWFDMRTDGEVFAESEDAQAEWDAFHSSDAAERRGDDGPFADSDAWIAEHYDIDDDGPFDYED